MAGAVTAGGAAEARVAGTGGSTIVREILEQLRVLVVGGMPAGVAVAGLGGRLAMLLLRLTSPDEVRGVTSDDGFLIGRVTLAGTYNLLMLGAFVGLVGAAAYRLVAPWLLGPGWFRRLTTGLASAAVAGSMLVHSDGVDFTALEPTWLAVALFVGLPLVFGVVVGVSVDRVARPGSWTRRGALRWVLPLLVVLAFPPSAPAVAFAGLVLCCLVPLRRVGEVRRLRATLGYGLVVRALWLAVAVAGLVALVRDVGALT